MYEILFVSKYDVCRGPMARFVMTDIIRAHALATEFRASSAGTGGEKINSPIHPLAERKLKEAEVPVFYHSARKMGRFDYEYSDLVVGMDDDVLREIRRIVGGDPDGKLRRLLDLTGRPGEIADPLLTGDFEGAMASISEGCTALMKALRNG